MFEFSAFAAAGWTNPLCRAIADTFPMYRHEITPTGSLILRRGNDAGKAVFVRLDAPSFVVTHRDDNDLAWIAPFEGKPDLYNNLFVTTRDNRQGVLRLCGGALYVETEAVLLPGEAICLSDCSVRLDENRLCGLLAGRKMLLQSVFNALLRLQAAPDCGTFCLTTPTFPHRAGAKDCAKRVNPRVALALMLTKADPLDTAAPKVGGGAVLRRRDTTVLPPQSLNATIEQLCKTDDIPFCWDDNPTPNDSDGGAIAESGATVAVAALACAGLGTNAELVSHADTDALTDLIVSFCLEEKP